MQTKKVNNTSGYLLRLPGALESKVRALAAKEQRPLLYVLTKLIEIGLEYSQTDRINLHYIKAELQDIQQNQKDMAAAIVELARLIENQKPGRRLLA